MKKLALVAFVGFALASCKKDYTCSCTTTDSSGIFPTTTTTTTLNGKKKDVEETCEKGSSTLGTLTTKCEIK